MELTGKNLTMAVGGLAWQQELTVAQNHKRAKIFCVRFSNWLDEAAIAEKKPSKLNGRKCNLTPKSDGGCTSDRNV